MECYVLGEDTDVTYEKWKLIQENSGGSWGNNLILNGNLQEFLSKDDQPKVILLACHCRFVSEGNREFYNLTNQVTFTYLEIQTWFDQSPTRKLELWFLTCENANGDVLPHLYNIENERNNNSKRIYPRVIVSEQDRFETLVSDEYIFHVLTTYFNDKGFPEAPETFRHGDAYSNSHLEFGLQLSIPRVAEDGVVYYGTDRAQPLVQWHNKISKDPQNYLTGPQCKNRNLLEWRSNEQNNTMVIHDHISVHSTTKAETLAKKFHIKSFAFASTSYLVRNDTLIDYLTETGEDLLRQDTQDQSVTIESKNEIMPYTKLTSKELRSLQKKNEMEASFGNFDDKDGEEEKGLSIKEDMN